MSSELLTAIVAIVGPAVGGLIQWLRSRPREKAKTAADARAELANERAAEAKLNTDRYNELQEDLSEERKARIADNKRMADSFDRQVAINQAQAQDLRVTTDYASQLRQWIEDRKAPPPPAWPVSLMKRDQQ